MKKPILIILLVFLAGGTLLNAQKRSKLPRATVVVPVQKQEKCHKQNPFKKEATASVTPVTTYIQEESLIADEHAVAVNTTHENQSGFTGMVQQTRSAVVNEKLQSTFSEKSSFTFSGSLLTSHTSLFKVKEVKKTALEVWVILLIVFYVLGLIFTVLCILATISWENFTLFIVFLILAVLFSSAGSLMLTLGQMGVL